MINGLCIQSNAISLYKPSYYMHKLFKKYGITVYKVTLQKYKILWMYVIQSYGCAQLVVLMMTFIVMVYLPI